MSSIERETRSVYRKACRRVARSQRRCWNVLLVLACAAALLNVCPSVRSFAPKTLRCVDARRGFFDTNSGSSDLDFPRSILIKRLPPFSDSGQRVRKGHFDDGGDDFLPPGRRRPGRTNPYARRFGRRITAQRVLVATNVIFFALQVRSAVAYLPTLNAVLSQTGYVGDAYDIMDVLEEMTMGSAPLIVTGRSGPALGSMTRRPYVQPLIVASSLGPFTMDFVHQVLLSKFQPHRLLTAGFLHGSLIHLIFNMRCLWALPSWLETGLGWPLYVSAYLVSVVTGSIAHSYAATTTAGVSSLCLGSSGGICGLNGLMFIMLIKMGNKSASEAVFKNMIWLVLFGLMTQGISNAAHIGGFLGGIAVGFLFGPSYGKSYGMMRKWSVEVDTAPRDYRRVMGFGMEAKRGMFPLLYLWLGAVLALLLRTELRVIPGCILRGFVSPGSLSGMRMAY